MPVKAIFFDVGGTLLDSDGKLFRNLAGELNKTGSKNDLKKCFFKEQSCLTNTNFKTIVQIISSLLIKNGFSQELASEKAKLFYKKSFVDNGSIYPDVLPTLKILSKKYILGIISDADSEILKLELSKFKLAPYFAHFSISSDVHAYKPAKEIFLHALKSAKVSANDTVYVGDMLEDIIGAKNIKMKSILLNRLNRDSSKLEVKPDFEIKSLAELSNIL